MKIVCFAFMFLFASLVNAQVFVKGKNINEVEKLNVIEMIVEEDPIASSGIPVSIDYGQARKGVKDKVTDASGKDMEFGSIVTAINHVENNGWTLIDHSLLHKGGSKGVLYRYYFRKKESVK